MWFSRAAGIGHFCGCSETPQAQTQLYMETPIWAGECKSLIATGDPSIYRCMIILVLSCVFSRVNGAAFSLAPISSLSAVCLNVIIVFRLSGVFPLWISYITRNLVQIKIRSQSLIFAYNMYRHTKIFHHI
ncbi:hypothetical protein PO909_012586 [Leuciscus waleckii]